MTLDCVLALYYFSYKWVNSSYLLLQFNFKRKNGSKYKASILSKWR